MKLHMDIRSPKGRCFRAGDTVQARLKISDANFKEPLSIKAMLYGQVSSKVPPETCGPSLGLVTHNLFKLTKTLSLEESVLRKDGAEEVVCFDCVELKFPLSTLSGHINGPHPLPSSINKTINGVTIRCKYVFAFAVRRQAFGWITRTTESQQELQFMSEDPSQDPCKNLSRHSSVYGIRMVGTAPEEPQSPPAYSTPSSNKMSFQVIILAPAPITPTQRTADIGIAITIPPSILCTTTQIFVRSLSIKLWQVITENMSQMASAVNQILSIHHWEGHIKLDQEVNMITHALDISRADPSYFSTILSVYQYIEAVTGISYGKNGRIQFIQHYGKIKIAAPPPTYEECLA